VELFPAEPGIYRRQQIFHNLLFFHYLVSFLKTSRFQSSDRRYIVYHLQQLPFIMATIDINENAKKRKAEGKPKDLQVELDDTRAEAKVLKARIKELEEQLSAAVKPGEDDLSDDDESAVDPNDKWKQRYQELREYRIINGDCKVPRTSDTRKKLAIWVKDQKKYYTNLKMNRGGVKLKPYQVALMDSIGMDWGTKFDPPAPWEDRFEELKKYKAAMRCDPPVANSNPNPLAVWVSAQRKEYKRFKKGQDSLLSMEQIQMLTEARFNWKGPRLSCNSSD
jgi:hypothetical protein